jgi:chemotaxis protein CheY-P-specific phosphatase CheC
LQPVEHIAKHSQNQDGGAVGLYMNLEGGLSGGFLFLIPDDAAKQIVAWLMRKSDPSSIVFDDLSYSALKETANIIGSAFLNSLTRQLDCQIFPSSPFILHDIAGSILDSLLAERAATESQSLMIEVSFISTESSFAWGMYFMPEWQPMEQILEGIAHG